MKLVLPDVKYKTSFIEAVTENKDELSEESLRYKNLDIDNVLNNFEEFVSGERVKADGKNLPNGYVPETIYWLIDNDEYVGRVSIRHELTEELLRIGGHIGYDIRPSKRRQGYGKKILELALKKAKDLGIDKALVTCDEDNLASKKIIEENGGIFEGSVRLENTNSRTLRYWISSD